MKQSESKLRETLRSMGEKQNSMFPWDTGYLRYLATVLVVIFLIAMIFIIKNAVDRHTYHSYRVMEQQTKSDSISQYEYVDGRLLRYSGDGASLMKTDFSILWDESYGMTNPKAAIRGDRILIYDRQGTLCNVYSGDQKIGAFETPLPILKADISAKGTVAVLLMDGSKSQFVYYKSDGTKIASGEATMRDPGYPADIALSPNGERMAVSYLNVETGSAGSVVEFYSFGKNSSESQQSLTASEKFSCFVPELYYPDNQKCVLIREDGVSVYRNLNAPKEEVGVKFQEEIVSTFHDEHHMAFLFRMDSGAYRMNIYTTNGNEVSSERVNVRYQNARVSDDQILFYQNNSFSIYSMKGFCRFRGELKEGNISDILKIGRNRYLVLTDESLEVIRLN